MQPMPQRNISEQRIWILTVLNKCVDSHDDGHVGLRLSIVHQIQVDQLLQLQVVCLHAVDHVREESRHVLAHSHAGNHLLHSFPFPLLLIRVQL